MRDRPGRVCGEALPPRHTRTPRPVARRPARACGLAGFAILSVACAAPLNSGSPPASPGERALGEGTPPAASRPRDASQAPARAPQAPVSPPTRSDPTPFPCKTSRIGEPDPESEIRRLAERARRSPADALVHNCLANALFDAGRLAEAIREYQEAIRLDGTLLEAHRNLAYALLDSGRREAAVEVLGKAVRLAPGDPALRVTLRSALRAMNHHP